MSYLLYLAVGTLLMWFCAKNELTTNDTTWIILAILTAAETISFRCKK